MLAVIRGIAVKVHQLQRTAGIRTYFAGIEVARLVQRLEDDLLRWKSAVVEGRLHGVEIVRSDGHQVATTTDVQMQFVLQIEEAGKLREMAEGHLLVVHVVVHVNVTKNSAHDIGTNQLPLKTATDITFVSFSTNILMRSCLGCVRWYFYKTSRSPTPYRNFLDSHENSQRARNTLQA